MGNKKKSKPKGVDRYDKMKAEFNRRIDELTLSETSRAGDSTKLHPKKAESTDAFYNSATSV